MKKRGAHLVSLGLKEGYEICVCVRAPMNRKAE